MGQRENKKCQVDKNIIKDVSIVNGKVDLKMRTTDKFNDSLNLSIMWRYNR